MKPVNFLKKLRSCLVRCHLFAFAGAVAALAQERQFPEVNFAITPPSGWHWATNLPSTQDIQGIIANAANTELVLFIAESNSGAGPVDDRAVSEFEIGLGSDGGKRLSGKYIEVDGVKAYERVGSAVIKGKHVSTLIYFFAADGRFYNMEAMRFDGEAAEDPDIQQAMDSFHFIKRPKTFIPQRSAAFQTGYIMGRLMGMMVLVVGVVALILFVARRNRPSRSQIPPPIPPSAR